MKYFQKEFQFFHILAEMIKKGFEDAKLFGALLVFDVIEYFVIGFFRLQMEVTLKMCERCLRFLAILATLKVVKT